MPETISEAARGDFLTVAELAAVCERNTVLDPYSVLVSRYATVGDNNTFYPGTVLQADSASTIVVSSGNVFFPGCFLLAENGGRLVIGSNGTFGPGGVQVKANVESSAIEIGNGVRIANGPEIVGVTHIGSGAQIIGAIQAQSVHLEPGGGHNEPDVDQRAGVLKGVGLARGLRVDVGEVINGYGNFSDAPIERQRKYHS